MATAKPICSAPNCNKPMRAKGLCNGHYKRSKKGLPIDTPVRGWGATFVFIDAHKDDVDTGECLKWPFFINPDGRAFMHRMPAARAMCKAAHGEPSDPSLEAAHLCGKGNEACVHPMHLAWKTRKENMDDMIVHGTRQMGETSHRAILTEAIVLSIRARAANGETGAHLAREFGVSGSAVYQVIRRNTWSHI